MKKVSLFLIAILSALFVACQNEESTKTQTLTIEPAFAELKVGETVMLDISNATDITWTSEDESVVTVYYGLVTAKAIGHTHVMASNGSASVSCEIFVYGTDGASLRITPASASIEKGNTFQFKGYTSYDLDLVWASSDESIVTIDQNGLATARKAGNATITLSNGLQSVTANVSVPHSWGEYKLVWSDEFNGTSLDESNWTPQIGGGGWGNQEKQYYTDRSENLRLEDGCLIIEAKKENYDNNNYTSARIYSKGKREFCYGKLEARINLPSGPGTWPAFWTLGNRGTWPNCGEIDIMEHTGNAPNRILGTLHTVKDRSGSRSSRAYSELTNIENNFHVYGVEWTQEEKNGKDVIRFYVDDVVYSEQIEEVIDNDEYWPFNRPNYFIINLALGGTLGGNIHDDIFNNPVIMKVDWVRVYQREEL